MKTITLLSIILLVCYFRLGAQTLSPEQLKTDLLQFQQTLQQVHPQMYRYTPKHTFDSLFLATERQLNQSMSQLEFYKTLIPLVAALHDGHIKLFPAGKDEHFPFFTETLFPLKLYFVKDQAWVAGNYGNISLPLGSQVLSINGKPVSSIIQTLLPNMTFADGYTINGKYSDLNHFFAGYYATFFGSHEQFVVVYLDGQEEKQATLAAVNEQIIKDYEQKHKPGSQKPFRLSYQDTHTAIMTIERFWNTKDEQSFKDFLKKSFRELKDKHIQHLVLDLRNNEGGNETYGVELYSYLAQSPFRYYDRITIAQKKKITAPVWTPRMYNLMRKLFVKKRGAEYVFTYLKGTKIEKPKKDAYTGKLYVLINGNSFSVTTEFAARVHADNRATFIGQETGGGYRTNSSGVFAITRLPHSGLEMGVPMLGFHMANIPAHIEHGQGIRPHYPVVPSVTDILSGNDAVMNYALQLIEGKATTAAPAPGYRTIK